MSTSSRFSDRPHIAAFQAVAVFAAVAGLGGCATVSRQTMAPGEVPVVVGPSVRDNVTPMETVLACFGDQIATARQTPITISVGDVKDYTGKYSVNEGNAITQGGALMVYSALGKLGDAVQVAERFDPMIAERELAYADRRQLGDGKPHELAGPSGTQTVPWLPYFGGTIQKSDYFIVGGITELNYNIQSGGGQLAVNQVGVRARTYNESVGIDLRVVNTRTLVVVKTISLTKQFRGYEVGANIFRFFDSKLFDIEVGAKGQEPIQLGVRAALEEGVVRLVAAVAKQDPRACLATRLSGDLRTEPAERLRKVDRALLAAPVAPSTAALPAAPAVAVNAAGTGSTAPLAATTQVLFEFGTAALSGATLGLMDQISTAVTKGPIEVVLVARESETWDAAKREALTDQRIGAISAALQARGVAPGAIAVSWRPDRGDSSVHRDGPGLQEIAKLLIAGAPAETVPQRR